MDDDPVRCLDPDASREMVQHINVQRKANESIGGVFEVVAFGLVPGLGSHVSWEERLDGRIAGALCSIQAIKGVGIGDGFDLAGMPGSQAHDEIFFDEQRGYHRQTNHAGGIEGGMTTGDPLVARAAMKPLPTLTQPLRSVDIATKEPAQALRERTDSCTVPAAGVVGEAMVALRPRRRLPGEVRRRPHRRRRRRARRLQAPHRVDPELRPALVLTGFMGAGKSSAARDVAAALGVEAQDTDRLLEDAFGCSIEEFFEREGEAAFRAREEDLVCALLESADGGVVALGGGAILSSRVRSSLSRHTTILLEVSPDDAWQRAAGKGRPLARDRDAFDARFAERVGLYEGVADVFVTAGDRGGVGAGAALGSGACRRIEGGRADGLGARGVRRVPGVRGAGGALRFAAARRAAVLRHGLGRR